MPSRPEAWEKPKANLSCEQCQQRKTKCDKGHPCTACQRAGLECIVVRRRRLPRGRSGPRTGRGADLKDRVARLENLLKDAQAGIVHHPVYVDVAETPPKVSGLVEEALASGAVEESRNPFWSAFSDEVIGIREILEDPSDDEPPPEPNAAASITFPKPGLILFSPSQSAISPDVLRPPPKTVVYALLDIFIHRVDPVFKVTHTPSLRILLLENGSKHLSQPEDPALQALKFAVYFTATCSLSEEECVETFQEEKPDLLNRYRIATEVSMSQADLLATSDIRLLQAFVIYLVGLRTTNRHRATWTLIACAIRIAQTVGLDFDEIRSRRPFEQEMRRRIWYQIGVLDLHAAFDGGSRLFIATNAFSCPPPLNIDDADISPDTRHLRNEPAAFTDMSFCSMTIHAMHCMRRLVYLPTDREGRPLQLRQEWTERYQIATAFEQQIQDKYLQFCNDEDPFQRYTKAVGEGMNVTMRLLVRRPMHRFYSTGPPPADGFNVLEVATEVLESALRKQQDASTAPWSWYAWVKWYALAVVLAELCSHDNERAWVAAKAGFDFYAKQISDGLIWKSIEKLMRKVETARQSQGRAIITPTLPPPNKTQEWLQRHNHHARTVQFEGHGWIWDEDSMPTNNHAQKPKLGSVGPSNNQNQDEYLHPSEEADAIMEDLMNESAGISWTNWELFIDDVGKSGQQDLLSPSAWQFNHLDDTSHH